MRFARILSAVAIASCIAAGPLHAQDKGKEAAPTTEVLLENDKVRVARTTFRPGDVSRAERRARANYVLTDGTLERTSRDGKKTVVERKAGTALWLEADADAVRNIGKANYVVLTVQVK